MPENHEEERVVLQIPEQCAGKRLDQVLADLLPMHSRSRLQQWIKAGDLLVDGRVTRPPVRVLGGEVVSGVLRLPVETADRPQAIDFGLCYEDADLLVLDKPAGLVAHPAAGNPDGTLVNALLHHAPELAELPRAGLVHRLDKDTTGLLVVARNPRAHTALVRQLQARTLEREYAAVVNGVMVAGGTIDAPIGRHPVDRKRMAVTAGGKPAVTHYRVLRRFTAHTHVQVRLETGRTHQIRVHLAHLRFPLLGDPLYGGRPHFPKGLSESGRAVLENFQRQALHAQRLALTHPSTGRRLEWRAEWPADLRELLVCLEQETLVHST
ncbi:MAG: 23S rRNA pseudouridine(1911/1915/1917) synthase RluD [Gammaproteobacteria bacterium]|nr:23S rRNA pseudouridine(1911/1915/1917) synthase RluD [Gammaproteobacteria bacterium]MCP5423699.1 23S rRNA pseudouridine(1911/1915/1917) synthase RluD [Gammaproteobacteria bacterium]